MAECESNFALTVRIGHLMLDGHIGTMAQHSLQHCSYLGRGAGLKLRINADRAAFHMPVDEDTWTAIARVPLGQEILIDRMVFFRVRSTGGCCGSPDGFQPSPK